MTEHELLEMAKTARKSAYAPYSGFKVGAALLDQQGRVWTGCNIECATYGATNCAERTAFFKAVSEGVRDFAAIAVVGGRGDEPDAVCTPCGICRQVMAEFCEPDFRIICGEDAELQYTLEELLPKSFSPKNLA